MKDHKRESGERRWFKYIGISLMATLFSLGIGFIGYIIELTVQDAEHHVVGEVHGKIVGPCSSAGNAEATENYILYVELQDGEKISVSVPHIQMFRIGGEIILYKTVSKRHKRKGYAFARMVN